MRFICLFIPYHSVAADCYQHSACIGNQAWAN